MEILSWNIMSGGFNGYDSTASRPERLELLIKAIKEADVDLVSLVDTHRWNEVFTVNELKEMFGYENAFIVKLDDGRLRVKGHDNGIAILTRLPVKRFETIRLATRNAIKTTMEGGLELFSVYFDDLSEDTRLKQATILLGLVGNKMSIIAGDLNTFDRDDLEESKRQIQKLYQQYPQLINGMKPVLDGMARAEVTALLKRRGLTDMGKNAGNTIPSPLFPVRIDVPVLRVDYGFCTPDVKMESFEVLRGGVFDQVSDHCPIKMRVSL